MTPSFPPPFPARLAVQRAPVELRFEDVSQEGRLVLQAIPSALGGTLWNTGLTADPVPEALARSGVVPILSRFQIAGYDGPISALVPLDATWSHQLARTDEGRFAHDAWLDLHGRRGRTYPTAESCEEGGRRLLVGRLYAESLLTRPFAPATARRVVDADMGELLATLPHRAEHAPASRLLEIPDGATALEEASSADRAVTVFGLAHSDSNQHVNSLVYFRLFEEAALRRLQELGRSTQVLGRALEIVYRKPCFAGNAVRVVQQAFALEGKVGVTAALFDESATGSAESLAQARPCTYARMVFES